MTIKQITELKGASSLPGNFGLPFLGEAFGLFVGEELFYWEKFRRHGSVFKTSVLGRKYAFLIGPEANSIVFKEQADCFSSRLGWWFLEPIFGNGLLMQDGAEHAAARRLMYPAFHSKTVTTYFDVINSIVQEYIKDWGTRGVIPLAADFRKLTLIVASRLFLGTQTIEEVEKTCDWFTQLVAGKLAIVRWDNPLTVHGRSQNARRKLHEYLRQTINRRRDSSKEYSDVLALLMNTVDEHGSRLSDSEIIEQTLLLLVAGHETTATLLSWLMFELASHPEWISKLRQELTQVAGDELKVEHLKQLTQMTNVLKEIERLYPPLYGIPRGVVKDIEYNGYQIPAGWVVVVSPMLTHRMKSIYSNPDCFDPDRFVPREEDKKYPFALAGFGHGPHSCLGFQFAQMEIKIILSHLLRQYDWSVTPEYEKITPVLAPSKFLNKLRAYIRPKSG